MSDEQEEDTRIGEEPVRERLLGDRLRRAEATLYGEAPDDVRAVALRARVAAAARPALSRRAGGFTTFRQRSWWEYTAGWGRATIPAALAAAAAAILLVIASRTGTAALLGAASTTEPTSIVAVAMQGASAPEVAEALVGPATREWLLTAAFASAPAASSDLPFVDSARR